MINAYNAQKRLELIFDCTYNAVKASFKHLPLHYIIEPPKQYFDAILARQIVIHIVRTAFNIPRRRIATALNRQRTTISFNIQTINKRLQEPNFAREYDRMADRALAAYQRIMDHAGYQQEAA